MEIGKRTVSTMQEFVDRDEIELHIFYFADWIETVSTINESIPYCGNGTTAWSDILSNIKATKANNVVLMTDPDMEYLASMYGSVNIPGCVWFIWHKDHRPCPKEMPQKLRGEQGTYEYVFE